MGGWGACDTRRERGGVFGVELGGVCAPRARCGRRRSQRAASSQSSELIAAIGSSKRVRSESRDEFMYM